MDRAFLSSEVLNPKEEYLVLSTVFSEVRSRDLMVKVVKNRFFKPQRFRVVNGGFSPDEIASFVVR